MNPILKALIERDGGRIAAEAAAFATERPDPVKGTTAFDPAANTGELRLLRAIYPHPQLGPFGRLIAQGLDAEMDVEGVPGAVAVHVIGNLLLGVFEVDGGYEIHTDVDVRPKVDHFDSLEDALGTYFGMVSMARWAADFLGYGFVRREDLTLEQFEAEKTAAAEKVRAEMKETQRVARNARRRAARAAAAEVSA